jgi:hypothetical protein
MRTNVWMQDMCGPLREMIRTEVRLGRCGKSLATRLRPRMQHVTCCMSCFQISWSMWRMVNIGRPTVALDGWDFYLHDCYKYIE